MSKRVAVIAVHGVGYCDPGDSAKRVSNMLLGLPEDVGAKYAPIVEETVHIPLHPLTITRPLTPGRLSRIQKMFEFLEERTSYLTRQWKTSKKYKNEEGDNAEVADDFMRLTLQDYRGAEHNKPKDARDVTSYITTCLKTARVAKEIATAGGGPAEGPIPPSQVSPAASGPDGPRKTSGDGDKKKIEVHVYEMYWADLTRPKNTILSFFLALYQLLFHLASLSRLAISTGYLDNQASGAWKALDRMQNYAVRMLTLPIPILNSLLFAVLFGLVPRFFRTDGAGIPDHLPIQAAIGALILEMIAYAFVSRWMNAKRKPMTWAVYPLVWGVLLAGIAYWAESAVPYHIVLSVEGLLLGALPVIYTVASYDGVRDGAKEIAIGLGALCALVIAWSWACGQAQSVQVATLYTFQVLLAALRVSWIFLFVFSLSAWVWGWLACRGIKKSGNVGRYARARAAVRTSRLALAMPTLGILIVTLAFWSGLFVKTSASNGQAGETFAVRLFGNSVEELHGKTGWFRAILLPGREVVRKYMEQVPAPFTVKTFPDKARQTTQVTISAEYDKVKQTTTLTVNPPDISLNLNPGTVTAGTDSAGAVTLKKPVPSDGAKVTVISSDPGVAEVKSSDPQADDVQGSKSVTIQPGLSVGPDPEKITPLTSSPDPGAMRPNDFFQGLLVWGATPGFPLALLFMLSGLFMLVLWVLPSVFTELDPPVRSENFDSNRMGDWLSRGLDSTKVVTGLVWCAAFVVLTAFALFYGSRYPRVLQDTKWLLQSSVKWANHFFLSDTAVILEYLGLAGSSLSILASLAGSGSPVLGIILDVDNYLRTSPKDATPRARIAERYVSLLRYVSEYKDPCIADDMGYDCVVIVAHSLGALISADLLRFLKVQGDTSTGRFYFNCAPAASAPPKITLRLFTMGNPLRQLLNRFFPYLYEWVRLVPDNSLTPLHRDPSATAPGIDSGAMPDPSLLEVERWVSAYRSGDYVGRSMWLDEWYEREVPAREKPDEPRPVYVATEDPPGRREEMCIGAGAHQHYWDQSAPDIAEKLDRLIAS
jgi:hypothetical protein